MKKSFVVFPFFSPAFLGFSSEIVNIEELPRFRTGQYSLQPYDKIVVFSAPRTGSSLTYNVCKFLFENEANLSGKHNEFDLSRKVLKTHKFSDIKPLPYGNVLYVVTVRNPMEASISNYRICPRRIDNIREFAEKLIRRHGEYLSFCEKLKEEGNNVLFIKYEDFAENPEALFTAMEKHFCITVVDSDRELMKRGYAKENVYRSVKDLPNFSEYLPISGFHGKHVREKEYEPPAELSYWLKHFLPEIEPAFKKYGYFSD